MLPHGGPHLGQLLEHEHTIDRTLGSICGVLGLLLGSITCLLRSYGITAASRRAKFI